MTDQANTPKKTVRFDIEGEEVPASPTSATSRTSSKRKTVRFAIDEADVPDAFVLEEATKSSKTLATKGLEGVLKPSLTSSKSATKQPDPDSSANISQPDSSTSRCPTLSATAIKAWRSTVPSGSLPPPNSPTDPPASPTTTPSSPTAPKAYEESATGVKVIQLDEGEKDGQGHVIEAVHEPCETCGGKVVWATKGEYLLICEGCQEPQ